MSSGLHIAHAVLSLGVGGLERIVLNLARSARQSGNRVSIICVERPGELAVQAEAEGAAVVSLNKPPGRLHQYVLRAATLLRDLSPDILHTHQIGAAWYLGQAARSLGRPPVLHTEHGNEFARSKSWWKNLKVRLFIHKTAKFIGQFCCVSDEIARAVTRWRTVPRAMVAVVPNGIPINNLADDALSQSIRKSLGIPEKALVVGTVGRLVEVKRHDLLIRAMSKVLPATPELHLILVGDGPKRQELVALARELNIDQRVHFAGYQTHPELYLRIMDVFALTSRSEGFPVSLLEAWVARLPVICSAVGGIPNVVTAEQDGLLFPSGDEGKLISSLSRLCSDPRLRERLATAGHRIVRERYSIERMASEYESRYRAILNTHTGAR